MRVKAFVERLALIQPETPGRLLALKSDSGSLRCWVKEGFTVDLFQTDRSSSSPRWTLLFLALIWVLTLVSCSNDKMPFFEWSSEIPEPAAPESDPIPDPTGSGGGNALAQYDFIVSQTPEVKRSTDVLFVVDNSGSMLDELNAVYQHIGDFTAQLAAAQIAFTIRLTTTDDQRLGQWITTNAGASVVRSEEADPAARLREVVARIPFPAYNGLEMGMRSAELALPQLPASPLTNIIIFSDEEDDSPGDIAGYIGRLQALERARATQFSFHPVIKSSASSCALGPDESPGLRYSALARAFEGGGSRVHDLCRLNVALSDLAQVLVRNQPCFTLPSRVRAPVAVLWKGRTLAPAEYRWEETSRSLCPVPSLAIAAGDPIRVLYPETNNKLLSSIPSAF